MIIVQGSARVGVDEVERVRAVMQWYLPACRGAKGCIYYAIAPDFLDPCIIHVSQRWVDEDAFLAHVRSADAARMADFLRKLTLTAVDFTSYVATAENRLMGD